MTEVTHRIPSQQPPFSPPLSSPHSRSGSDSEMSSALVATPQPIPPFSSESKDVLAVHLQNPDSNQQCPLASPGCGIEFNITLSSPVVNSPNKAHALSIASQKRTSPILERHKSISTLSSSSRRRRQRPDKGYLEPHVSNLPRRRRVSGTRLSHRPSPLPLSSEDGNEGMDVDQSSPAVPTPITIPSLPAFMAASLPGSPVDPTPQMTGIILSRQAATPEPTRGHLQPHVNNLPRRKRRLPDTVLSEAEMRLQRRFAWERQTCACEVGGGSGVYVAFLPEDGDNEEWLDEFMCVICIDAEAGGEKAPTAIVSSDRVLQLSISDSGARDDGLPHLSTQQLSSARAFVYSRWEQGTDNSSHHRKRVLVMAPRDRPADAMAAAIMLIACAHDDDDHDHVTTPPSSRMQSNPVKNPLLRVKIPPRPPLSRPMSPVHKPSDFSEAMKVDNDLQSEQSVLVPEDLHRALEVHTPIHSIVMRVHDLAMEDDGLFGHGHGGLKDAWRGVLSRDGMDYLADCIYESESHASS